MAYRIALAWLPFAIVERPTQDGAAPAAEEVHGIPELRRPDLISDVLQHPDDPAAADLVKYLPAELRVVPLLVDGEGAFADYRDAAIGRSDELVPTDVALTGKQ